jgi:hypothetical protein
LQGVPGEYRDFYDYIKGGWFPMEVGTVAAGLVALRYFRFPFLTAPLAFALWFMSMDLTPLIYGSHYYEAQGYQVVSLVFGLVVLAGAHLVDRRTEEDFAFWGTSSGRSLSGVAYPPRGWKRARLVPLRSHQRGPHTALRTVAAAVVRGVRSRGRVRIRGASRVGNLRRFAPLPVRPLCGRACHHRAWHPLCEELRQNRRRCRAYDSYRHPAPAPHGTRIAPKPVGAVRQPPSASRSAIRRDRPSVSAVRRCF